MINITYTLDLLVAPEKIFRKIKSEPLWKKSSITLIIVILIVETVYSYIEFGAFKANTQNLMDKTKQLEYVEVYKIYFVISLVLIPIYYYLKWFAISGLLYFLMLLINKKILFKHVFSVLIHCWFIIALKKIFQVIIIYVIGTDTIIHPNDLEVIPNLGDLFTLSDNGLLAGYLDNLDLFSVWYILLLTIGLSIVAESRKLIVLPLVSLIWILMVSCRVFNSSMII